MSNKSLLHQWMAQLYYWIHWCLTCLKNKHKTFLGSAFPKVLWYSKIRPVVVSEKKHNAIGKNKHGIEWIIAYFLHLELNKSFQAAWRNIFDEKIKNANHHAEECEQWLRKSSVRTHYTTYAASETRVWQLYIPIHLFVFFYKALKSQLIIWKPQYI